MNNISNKPCQAPPEFLCNSLQKFSQYYNNVPKCMHHCREVGSRSIWGSYDLVPNPAYTWDLRHTQATHVAPFVLGIIPRNFMYFSFNPSDYLDTKPLSLIENIARLLDHVEEQAKFNERSNIQIVSNHRSMIKVTIAKDWLDSFTSIYLFTLMLRLGPYFVPDMAFYEVLNKHSQAAKTKPAICRYIYENCRHYTGRTEGWENKFRDQNANDLKKLLIDKKIVTDKAAKLWALAGKPANRDREFWLQACNEISAGKY